MPDEGWLDQFAARFRRPLQETAAGTLPPNVALMHLLIESSGAGEAGAMLDALRAALAEEQHGAGGLHDVVRLYDAHPHAFATVKAVLARVAHGSASGALAENVGALSAAFDHAVRSDPEGSVALYALGSPDLLREATAEVVAVLREWGLFDTCKSVLEIGCGIGRFQAALAAEVALAVGIDVSRAMLTEARRRCAGLPNAAFVHTSGLDLAAFADRSFDFVLAVDSFPYLVQAGLDLAASHIEEAARVLQPGGDLVILNYSYRDLDRDRADVAAAAAGNFAVLADGIRPFRLWDGAAFHLRRLGTAAT